MKPFNQNTNTNTTKPQGRSGSSCAACKLLKRRCSAACIFAPYFRSDEPKKFAKVHKVFGAANVSKILVDVPEEHRHDAVNSLAYEADARLRDPVYGCIGAIALLEQRMMQLQHDLALARSRLAHYASVTAAADPLPAGVFHAGCDTGVGGGVGIYDETAVAAAAPVVMWVLVSLVNYRRFLIETLIVI
ncbi:hypothetical protein V2J09_012530 [Rumex salicifolius]